MQVQRAHQILQSLVQGTDPFTGAELPPGTVLQQADVIRALLAGASALEQLATREARRAQLPRNIGRAWSEAEQASLLNAFHAGEPLADIARRHGRTLRAIEARLQKLGLLTADQRTTRDRFAQQDPPAS
jgi:catalase (peroxidase I)